MNGRAGVLIGFVGLVAVGAGALDQGSTAPPLAPAAADKEAEIAKASLVVNLTTREGFKFATKEDRLLIMGLGTPEEADAPWTLVDETGLEQATVDVVTDKTECDGLDVRDTGLGESKWCLRLSGLDSGTELKGTITGADMNLELTVSQRYHFLGAPLLLTFIGVGLGVLSTWATTKLLPGLLVGTKLDKAVDRLDPESDGDQQDPGSDRDQQDPNSDGPRVAGLRGWAKSLRDSKGPTATLEAVREIERRGLAKARQAREALAVAVAKSSLPEKHDLTLGAKNESARGDAVADFYTEDGEAVEEHPARTWIGLLDRAERLLQRTERAAAKARKFVAEGPRSGLKNLVETTRQDILRATDAAALGEAENAVRDLEDAISEAIANSHFERAMEGQLREARGVTTFAFLGPSSRVGLEETAGLGISAPDWKLSDIVRGAVVGKVIHWGLIALQIVLALYTVLAAVYMPSHTFGSLADWAELTAAAFAASAITQIVGLATIGDSTKP